MNAILDRRPVSNRAEAENTEVPQPDVPESFIVRVWLEEPARPARRAPWRGHITHVPTGDRKYVQDLRGIVAFIAPYLDRMHARVQPWWRVQQWWKQKASSRTKAKAW